MVSESLVTTWNCAVQRLEGVVEDATGVWKTLLYMSYATVQRHMAFREIL